MSACARSFLRFLGYRASELPARAIVCRAGVAPLVLLDKDYAKRETTLRQIAADVALQHDGWLHK